MNMFEANNPMMGMFPPGVQQLIDLLPDTEVLDRVAEYLQAEPTEDGEKVSAFLTQLAAVIRQHMLSGELAKQTEPLKLECGECHKQFVVDNPLSYRRRVEEGFLCACADGHDPVILGSGRLGELSADEALTNNNDPNVRVIYPADYESPTAA